MVQTCGSCGSPGDGFTRPCAHQVSARVLASPRPLSPTSSKIEQSDAARCFPVRPESGPLGPIMQNLIDSQQGREECRVHVMASRHPALPLSIATVIVLLGVAATGVRATPALHTRNNGCHSHVTHCANRPLPSALSSAQVTADDDDVVADDDDDGAKFDGSLSESTFAVVHGATYVPAIARHFPFSSPHKNRNGSRAPPATVRRSC